MANEHQHVLLHRLSGYIGRDEVKRHLRTYSRRILEEDRCFALYFEARGGMGKTHLLERYPLMIEQDEADLAARLRVSRLVDFYAFESRNPLFIEDRLITGLKQGSDDATHMRLPPDVVDETFQPYTEALRRYRQIRDAGKPDEVVASNDERIQAFITCWNALSHQHPLVIFFDTLETLFSSPAPPEALSNVDTETTSADLVIRWMLAVLPHLRHTLVLLSGRPVEDNRLVVQLQEQGLLIAPVQQLAHFHQPEDIHAYLSAYNIQIPDDLYAIKRVTDGRPLLLTCYAEMLRIHRADLPQDVGTHGLEKSSSLLEFEDWLIDTILNPLRPVVPAPNHEQQQTMDYCFYFLAIARRGLTQDELKALFARFSLPCHEPTINTLDQVTLIKRIGDRLFLHDEIFVMIDGSGKPDESGLQPDTLNYLCEVSKQRVREAERDHLLGAMADHMYYEMTRDIQQGYRFYMVYADWLLRDRRVNQVLALSDVFWTILNQRIVREGYPERRPYRDKLMQSSLSEKDFLHGEQVRRVKLLRANNQHNEAHTFADNLHAQLLADGIIPLLRDNLGPDDVPPEKDLYLFVDLNILRAITTSQAMPSAERQPVKILTHVILFLEQTFMQLIDLAQTGARPIDPMLHLRRDYFSGEAYKFRGYLHRVEQRFDLAEADARKARETYDAYMKHGALELNDRILSELAHASNNLAFALANNGHLEKALNVSNDLLSPKKNLMRYLSDYHKALFYNTNALIFMFRAEYLRAEEPIRQAEQAAQSSGNNRAKGLVRWARAHLERSKMEEQRKIDITINQLFQQAADLLAEEPDQLIHLYHDWAGYERDIYLRAREIADESDDHMDAATYAQNALQRLHKAQHLLEQADDKGISNMMRQADLLESMATLHNLMGNYAAAREYVGRAEAIIQAIPGSVYVQVVCAKIALQSAVATLYDHPDSQQYQDALRLMAIALARVYIFARRHRDQQIIERVIKDLLDDTPPDELRAFLQRLKKHAFSVPAEALGYQIPDATQWAIVMGAGLRFLQESINVCLGDY